MPSLVISGAAQIRLIWSLSSPPVQALNVLGAAVSGSVVFDQTLANSLGSAIKGSLTSSGMAAVLSTTTSLVNIGVRDLRSANNAEFLDSGAAVPGTGAAGDELPRQAAYCVSLRTAKAGPSYRGRVYLGGFTELQNTASGGVNASVITASVAFLNAIKANLASASLTLAVLSRPAEKRSYQVTIFHADGSSSVETRTQNARPGAATPVVAVIGRNAIWDSQRRRTSAGSVSTLFGPAYGMYEDGTAFGVLTQELPSGQRSRRTDG